MLLELRLGLVRVLVWLLVRRLRLAVLSLISAAGEVAAVWTAVRALDLSTNVVVGSLAAGENRVREVGGCSGKDTLVCRCVVSIIVIAAGPASAYATEVEVELLLWVDISIHIG